MRGGLIIVSAVASASAFTTAPATFSPTRLHPASPTTNFLSSQAAVSAAAVRSQRSESGIHRRGVLRLACSVKSSEDLLLQTLKSTGGRGQRATGAELEAIGAALDELERVGGIKNPVTSPTIQGEWDLVFTSKSKFDLSNPLGARIDGSTPGVEGVFRLFGAPTAPVEASSSPIQRTVTAIEGLTITQNIKLGEGGRVDQRVGLGDSAYLRLSASASTSPAENPIRIDFMFDLAYFQLGPLRIPYPVPFRLLGKEACGWLDTVYLSDRLRVSRGNKGTTFVLARPDQPRGESFEI